MPTKPIPAGTVNFPVNMPRGLRAEAGRHAFQKDKALGQWIRELIIGGLNATKSALGFRTEAMRAADDDKLAMQLLRRAIATNGGIGPEDADDIRNALEFVSRSAARDLKLAEAVR